MPLDPAKAREVLACSVFRAAGVPPAHRLRRGHVDRPRQVRQGVPRPVRRGGERGRAFLADRFGTDKGLLMKPFQVRGVELPRRRLGTYKGKYRPQSAATKEQTSASSRSPSWLTGLATRSSKEIDSYLDVDAFLRFLAANALTSNLQSVFALGHNYHLYLDPKTNKFVFLPGDLEFSLANFLLMGTADQLMDLSLMHPYPGARTSWSTGCSPSRK